MGSNPAWVTSVLLTMLVLVLALWACSPTGAAPTNNVTVNAVSSVQPGALASPTGTPGPLASPAALTDADNGAVVQLHAGEQVELRLDPALMWTVTLEDASIVQQSGSSFIEAVAPGTTTLSANGEPACRRATPPCGLPNRLFQVEIDVSP